MQKLHSTDLEYQHRALREVSRTFALTIPQLPAPLARVVGNGYLLCRIADTIEDDRELDGAAKEHYAERFITLLEEGGDGTALGCELVQRLAAATPAAERELLARLPSVLRVTAGFNSAQRSALRRCVRIMGRGMARFQRQLQVRSGDQPGLENLEAVEDYCYHVAGVVGEMLTELFCDYSPAVAARRTELLPLAVAFGQGLQMTNILKDIWEDRQRGACWLPRSVFREYGFDLERLGEEPGAPGFRRGLELLLGVAAERLRGALDYTLLIPRRETGIRRFCLWALGMAVLTLRRIHRRPDFTGAQQVKISRRAVRVTAVTLGTLCRMDTPLRLLFTYHLRALPKPPAAARPARAMGHAP